MSLETINIVFGVNIHRTSSPSKLCAVFWSHTIVLDDEQTNMVHLQSRWTSVTLNIIGSCLHHDQHHWRQTWQAMFDLKVSRGQGNNNFNFGLFVAEEKENRAQAGIFSWCLITINWHYLGKSCEKIHSLPCMHYTEHWDESDSMHLFFWFQRLTIANKLFVVCWL